MSLQPKSIYRTFEKTNDMISKQGQFLSLRLSTKMPGVAALFYSLIFLSLLLPSGGIGPINAKFLLLLLIIFILPFLRIRLKKLSILFIIFAIIFCLFWLLVGLEHQADAWQQPLAQFKAFAATIVIPTVCYILLYNDIVNQEKIFKIFITSTVVIAVIKISLLVYSAAMGLNFIALTENLARFFGTQIMTMEIAPSIYRLQISADLAIPISIFIILFSDDHKISFKFRHKIVLLIVLLLSGFIAYSRYIWGFVAAVIVAHILFRHKVRAMLLTAGFLLIVSAFIFSNKFQIFDNRFSSLAVDISDSTRFEQYPALFHGFLLHPYIGQGFGAYLPNLIRDSKDKFSYEAQWASFLMQLGIFGLIAIFIMLAPVIASIIKKPLAFNIAILVVLILWLGSGFYNPYLTSSISGAIFVYFVAVSSYLSNRDNYAL